MIRYYKFVDKFDDKKYFIYEWVRGVDDFATFRKGRVVGKKTCFEKMDASPDMPLSFLRLNLHNGQKMDGYETIDELEAELFLEAFLEY